MNGGKDSEEYTVGYRYYVGIHAALCVGEIDGVFKVSIDDKEAWAGRLVGTGRITINKWELFGGDSREGGIKGDVDILTGSTTQGSNDYLAAKLGATNIPSFRGVCSVVLRQIYMGINPYLKKWVWRVQRIHKTSAGATQWYNEKAGIPVYAEIIPPGRLAWRYKVVGLSDTADYSAKGYDDSGWGLGYSPFADKPWAIPGVYNFPTVPSTVVPQQKKVWVRSTITIDGSVPDSFFFDAFVDNGVEVWINGAKALSNYEALGHYYSADIPGSFFVVGANQITVLGRDDSQGVRDSNWFWFDFRLQDTTKTYLDMNPAHIIRECFVDQVWGYGVDAGEIDDDWFASSADALFNDATGLSFFLQSNDIDSFVQTVLEHIDAVIRVDNQTGKIQLKLIRGDYDADDLLELNPSNIESVSDYSRPSPSELINEVVVKYWDHSTGNEATLTIQDIGRIQAFGGVISTTKDFTGASNFAVAAKLGQRYLKNVGADRVSCSITANRVASALQKGDVFRLSWPKYGVESMVMRVISIDYGDGVSNKITIKCTQDTFALPDFSIVSTDDGSLWSDPKLPPAAVGYRMAFEVPYYELVRRQGQDAVDERLVAMPEAGYIGVACVSPTPATINARIWTDSGAGYAEYGSVDFCPSAILAAAIGYINTVIAIENGVDLDLAATGTWAQIDDELVAIDAISETAITVRRGVLDTVPAQHSAGSRIFLWSGYSGGDRIEYVAGEEVDIKLLPVTGSGVLALSEAPVDTVTLNERAIRPYPPGNVQVNGARWPASIGVEDELAVTWAHRDRTQQTSGTLQDYTYGDIGPEPGTTYAMRIYHGQTNALLRTVTGLTGTGYTYPAATEITDGGGVPIEDPYWANVVLAMPMDGANGSTTFTDISPTPKAVTRYGNAQISTAQSKFGGASAYFDGTGDYLTIPHSDDFNLSSGDFTVEFWFYLPSARANRLISKRSVATSKTWSISVTNTGVPTFNLWNSAGTYYSATGPIAAFGAWVHVAAVRSGDIYTVFINGVAGTPFTSTVRPYTNTDPLAIGVDLSNSALDNTLGYIDDLRITKGVARYTANFTPPTKGISQYIITGGLSPALRFELESVRGGLVSLQKWNLSVTRA